MKTSAAFLVLCFVLSGVARAIPVSDGSIFHETFTNFPEDPKSNFVGAGAFLEGNHARILTEIGTEGVFRVNRIPEKYPSEYVVEYDWTLQAPSGDNFYMFYAQQNDAPYFSAIGLRTFQEAPGVWNFQVDYGNNQYEQFLGYNFNQTYHVTIHIMPGPTKPVDLYLDGLLLGTYDSRNPSLTTDLVQWGDPSSGQAEGDALLDNISIGLPMSDQISGDFDGNHFVDGSDLAKWKTDFGTGNGSDANHDGNTDGSDFLIWQRNLGMGSPPAASAVPEPAAGLLAAVGLLAANLKHAAKRRSAKRARTSR